MTRQEDQAIYSIGAVARMLDIPTSTLRAWEERHSVITPHRSQGSQRLYSRAPLEQPRFVKSRLESGSSAADAHRLLPPELTADGARWVASVGEELRGRRTTQQLRRRGRRRSLAAIVPPRPVRSSRLRVHAVLATPSCAPAGRAPASRSRNA